MITQGSREAMLDQLVNDDIDLTVGVFPDLSHELHSADLFEESFACLVDRNTLPANGVLDLPNYLARPHVLVEMRGGGAAEIKRALTAIRERRRVAITLPHWNVAPQLIAGTDLILTIAARGVHKVSDPQLEIVPPPFKVPAFSFVLTWHKRRDGNQALTWLRGELARAVMSSCF